MQDISDGSSQSSLFQKGINQTQTKHYFWLLKTIRSIRCQTLTPLLQNTVKKFGLSFNMSKPIQNRIHLKVIQGNVKEAARPEAEFLNVTVSRLCDRAQFSWLWVKSWDFYAETKNICIYNSFYGFFLSHSHIFLVWFCTFSCNKFQKNCFNRAKNLLSECLAGRRTGNMQRVTGIRARRSRVSVRRSRKRNRGRSTKSYT